MNTSGYASAPVITHSGMHVVAGANNSERLGRQSKSICSLKSRVPLRAPRVSQQLLARSRITGSFLGRLKATSDDTDTSTTEPAPAEESLAPEASDGNPLLQFDTSPQGQFDDFLRVLAIIFVITGAGHVADVLGPIGPLEGPYSSAYGGPEGPLPFSEFPTRWQYLSYAYLVACPAAAVGNWLRLGWAQALFAGMMVGEVALFTVFADTWDPEGVLGFGVPILAGAVIGYAVLKARTLKESA